MCDEGGELNSPTGLPIELICHIVAFVDGSDDDDEYEDRYSIDYRALTLASCSLVCKAWSNIARAHIFGSFTIDYNNFESRLSFLHFTAPHLGGYVIQLTISGDNNKNTDLSPPQWTPEAFSLFSNLRSLSFHHVTGEWSSLPTPLARGFATLLTTSSLRKVCLRWWNFGTDTEGLQNMLSLCSTTLKDLTLVYVDCNGEPRADALPHVSSLINMKALSNLRLVCVHHPRLVTALVECPNLKSMTADIDDGQLLVPLAVEDLRLIINSRTQIPKFQSTARLSTLGIKRITPPTTLSNIHAWMNACINKIPHPSLITHLVIELSHDRAVAEYPELADYKAFSASLARLRNRGGFQQISVSIMVYTHDVSPAAYAPHQTREVEKLKDGFASILGPGVDVRLYVQGSWSVLMDCRV
ncbi:hypothetical protein AB1N83_008638 [Pleurotus pulmonarius]